VLIGPAPRNQNPLRCRIKRPASPRPEITTASRPKSFFLIAPASVGEKVALRHHEAMRELVGELAAGAPKRRGKSEPAGTREQALAGGISRLVVRKLDDVEAEKLGELLPALAELVLRPYIGSEEAAHIAGG
jgi:hypothetical protein